MPNNTATEQMVTLVLPVSKVNTLLAGLAELPFKVSSDLIVAVQNQANADIKRQQEFLEEQTKPVDKGSIPAGHHADAFDPT